MPRRGYDPVWKVIVWPFNSTTSALRYLRSTTRFWVAYVSRSRRPQAKPQINRSPEDNAQVDFEESEGFELEDGRRPGKSIALIEEDENSIRTNSGTCRACSTMQECSPQTESDLVHKNGNGLEPTVTCHNGTNSCWACNIQICTKRTSHRQASSPNIQQHMDHCIPYCHKCYFKEICREKRALPSYRQCSHTMKVNAPAMRSLCKDCSLQTIEEITLRREAREKQELALLANQAIRCGNCALGLPTRGPRWWVCDLCRLECTDPCHYAG